MINLISDRFFVQEPRQSYGTQHYWLLAALFILGLAVRFWGLGNVGLHGDEEIMALAVRGILDTGLPYHPSGMLYPRALSQLYLMSTSVWLFGETEWALRLPSVIVGACCTLAAFSLGRRFLEPGTNLILVTVMTFLPVMIEISQTARMYVFLVFGLMIFGTLIFRWERTRRLFDLGTALVVWLVVMEIHTLAVFALPLFLFPGLCRASTRQVVFGTAAALSSYAAFGFWAKWVDSHYPSSDQRPELATVSEAPSPLDALLSDQTPVTIAFVMLGVVVIAVGGMLANNRKLQNLPAVSLLLAGYCSCALLHYHFGLILLFFGVIEWSRNTDTGNRLLIILLMSIAVMLAFQLGVLHNTGEYPGRKLIGAIVGSPSVWPAIKLAAYSPIALLTYAVIFIYAARKVANRERVPDHFLFFGLAVWGPVVGIGLIKWYVPSRYTLEILPFLLLCCVAGLQFWYQDRNLAAKIRSNKLRAIILGGLFTVLSINPIGLSKVVGAGYERYPDHKGAAEFIQRLRLSDKDVVIAEDALQQTYYLGFVDYRLLNIDVAREFAYVADGQPIYQYTGTPIIGTGEELEQLLEDKTDGDIYIVGSGENFADGRSLMRGRGISAILESEELEVIFVGRDHKTMIWKKKRSGTNRSKAIENNVTPQAIE